MYDSFCKLYFHHVWRSLIIHLYCISCLCFMTSGYHEVLPLNLNLNIRRLSVLKLTNPHRTGWQTDRVLCVIHYLPIGRAAYSDSSVMLKLLLAGPPSNWWSKSSPIWFPLLFHPLSFPLPLPLTLSPSSLGFGRAAYLRKFPQWGHRLVSSPHGSPIILIL